MHLYMIVRGIKHDVDRFINGLSERFLPFKYKGKDSFIQVSVRPIQLYEIAFPKEHLDVMINTLKPDEKCYEWMENTKYKWLKKYAFLFRKLLKLKPIPKAQNPDRMVLYGENVERILLGLKEDENLKDGETEGI